MDESERKKQILEYLNKNLPHSIKVKFDTFETRALVDCLAKMIVEIDTENSSEFLRDLKRLQ